MRWEGNRESDNVEDRRGDGGGGGGFSFGGGSLGIGGVVVALVLSYVLGVSPSTILGLMSGGAPQQQAQTRTAPANDETTRFVRTVLADTEDVWGNLFRQQGETYAQPKLVLFSGRTPTACGTGQSATGPFYCPPDQRVYIDLDFFKLMQQRFHVTGEFAQAYVIAHEIGHHVQNLMGLSDKVHNAQQRLSEAEGNALSVKLELQADCFAGVWAFHANRSRQILEQGDIETALSAATAIGDDALQRQSQGYVVPDSFTHGTSAQRVRWFRRGIDSGEIAQCDTFSGRRL
ncbi:KPN_02809 family neutral zinc metallopeptidase [Pseudoduganella armeniaca]|uniref:Metalloprotease n=1 Tax=Pseudoduganella armeniaca TaxID=2072590 RepID=A0A2R4C728_9BURK|nr:neutral zinc metallopeptidase [Pseudoduganella armeniaca]AVR95405.1 metalloprotease [Pseudoduganella armeniaca]